MKKAFFLAVFFALAFSALKPVSYAECASGLKIVSGDRSYSFSYPEIKNVLGQLRLSGKSAVIDDVCAKEYVAPKNATVTFEPDKKQKFSFTKERAGKTVDKEKLVADVDAALSVGGGSVCASVKTVPADVTVEALKKMTYERGRFSTSFATSSEERSSNIRLAAKTISGRVVESGEVFSFNAVVGERSEARGYKQAKIIKNGKFEDGLGGGVCQVSTTLYNAALLSGLEIAEYHPHTLAVSYVEKSFDAMVSYGSADLKIRNVTDGKIFIAAYASNKTLTFVIYGIKSDESIRRRSVVESVIEPKTQTIETDKLIAGEKNVLVAAKSGAVSKGYLIITKNGKTTVRLIRSDSYKSVDGVTEIGTRRESAGLYEGEEKHTND